MAEIENPIKKQTKQEKKVREAMAKVGLVPVNDIFRFTLRQKGGLLIVVAEPEVYASPSGETYAIFGETTFDDMSQARATKAAKNVDEITKAVAPEEPVEEIVAETVSNDDEEVDLQGLDPKDVEIVMKETKAPKAKVVEVLKKTGDIVTAVLELTM
ncbi:hypothetical protein DICPUDRAFT_49852 [Dictyostelium purpureum]|uniref:NAC-A/B domain-containing protein n=1 Tax=Dictyostelium purpureum TaxID=5786 RepID=F0ZVN7_DICPU|nr:uncharacterized protein DICPUDRAFT_49852 [Dictyostelium purpureum]EGC31991.1 hypothetical protein DICPUDRAFT_49852 [Dictyostelium purpureum]|eukprot:XP_003291489.1 hypothetical protein DICPUDRAFT_49852 [Dictyostelium purpureum]